MRKSPIAIVITTLFISACSSVSEPYEVASPYLQQPTKQRLANQPLEEQVTNSEPKREAHYSRLPALDVGAPKVNQVADYSEQFSNTDMVTMAADSLPMNQFLHYVLGDVLHVNYILSPKAKNDANGVTLNLQQQVSKRKLFLLMTDVLGQAGYDLVERDDIFYINPSEGKGSSNVMFGYGRNVKDIPKTSGDISQIVPLLYPVKPGVNTTLQQLAQVKALPDYDQNAMVITGRREEVTKALEFLLMVDAPVFRDRQVGMYKSKFVSADELSTSLQKILENEGIKSSSTPANAAISVMALPRISSLVMFANDPKILERANFWLKKLDAPSDSEEKQYFTYVPTYARASDIQESLSQLWGGTEPSKKGSNGATGTTSANTVGNPNSSGGRSNGSTGSSDVNLMVDQRSNSLVVNCTGKEYQQLYPLLQKMDVMPKQVMLEVMIAEVTMSGAFSQGVEWALSQGALGDLNLSTQPGLGDLAGGLGLTLNGVDGSIVANFLATNEQTNVLSRPSLVVRDGVTADMSVGNEVPITSSTTTYPDSGSSGTSTQNIQYRKTGVQLSVTPTVNSQGVVIMEISQSNSNTASASATNTPTIFERSINTEVVAESGQTVILGGLISENKSKNRSKVPLLGDIPVLGHLFSNDSESSDKTELVILVTPRIIESSDEWDDMKNLFMGQMSQLKLSPSASSVTPVDTPTP